MKPRYIMVGGFLGAGKTTALLRLGEYYRQRGLKVGLITNDQSVGLVDTALLANHDFPVQEITGGCFCCRFNTLTDAAEKLSTFERPDVFLAEPVGSCTDLTATVSYPLRRLYGENYTIAPFSVLIDPQRAERILGLASGKSFSPKVVYIYRKQLEEADIIVINKLDLLDVSRVSLLIGALQSEYPHAKIIPLSARHGTQFDTWTAELEAAEQRSGNAMDVDYDTYAEGEALLGWLNLTATLHADKEFSGNGLISTVMKDIHTDLQVGGVEIAHLKMTLSPSEGKDLAVMNLVRSGGVCEASQTLDEDLTAGQLIVNLRAEADPEELRAVCVAKLNMVALKFGVALTIEHLEAFRPGRPVPTHRDAGGV